MSTEITTEPPTDEPNDDRRRHRWYAVLIGAAFSVSLFVAFWYVTGLVLSLDGTAGAARLSFLAVVVVSAFVAGARDVLLRLDPAEFSDRDRGDR